MLGKNFEFGIGFDCNFRIIRDICSAEKDGDFVRLSNQDELDLASYKAGVGPSRIQGIPADLKELGEDARDSNGPTSALDIVSWGDVPQYTDLYFGVTAETEVQDLTMTEVTEITGQLAARQDSLDATTPQPVITETTEIATPSPPASRTASSCLAAAEVATPRPTMPESISSRPKTPEVPPPQDSAPDAMTLPEDTESELSTLEQEESQEPEPLAKSMIYVATDLPAAAKRRPPSKQGQE